MKSKLSITIKKRSQTSWQIWMMIMLMLFSNMLISFFGFPWSVRYLMDVVWITSIAIIILNYHKIDSKGINNLVYWIVLFLIVTLLVYMVQYQSALYYLWGFRNNFRFYAAFFLFALFLKNQDIENYLRVFDKLFWLNAAISLVQYFAFGIKGDYLGGIFGAESGVNGYTNIFFVVVITKSIVYCIEKKETSKVCISKCIAALYVAALAELKFFFVEFAVILIMAIMLTEFTWRKFAIILGGIAGLSVCTALLMELFPVFDGWFSFDRMFATASNDKGYTGTGDLNRMTAISRINELWLTNVGLRLFGLGLGNCDTSSFALVNTPFYEQYGHMHYTWMSYSFMYLECGWIGLIFYFGFFALVYLAIGRIERSADPKMKSCCCVSKILAICCTIISIYNGSLRTEAGYMAYFVLAIPFALNRDSMRKIR